MRKVGLGLGAAVALALCVPVVAQPAGPQPAQTAPARAVAPWDPTGTWVSLVTEDWRFRMLVAPVGDYEGIALTPTGRELADAWDPAADEAAGHACRAYGAGGLMRMPTRLQFSWEGDEVLRIDSDAGQQTRLLKFGGAQDGAGAGTLQGVSNAVWDLERAGGFNSPVVSGSLEVRTTDMAMGYLRRNGVPYSEEASLTEYFERVLQDNGDEYLIVISVLEDPRYLAGPVITSSNFKREADDSRWDPRPCEVR